MSDEPKMDLEESEDLFDFAEIYTPPASATPVATIDAAEATAAATFDESDCLFNFDELSAESESVSVDAASIMASVPEVSAGNEATAKTNSPIETVSSDSLAAPSVQALTDDVATETATALPVVVTASAGLSLRSPIVLILLVTMLVNLGVIGFTWRVSGEMREEFGQATRFIIQATQEIQTKTEANVAKLESFQSPVISEDPEHEHTFDRVQLELERGEFKRARRRLYSLLSIADRLEPEVREKVESTAQFVLADIALQVALSSKGPTE